MTSGSKMRSDNSMHFDKALGVSGAFESSHAPLPLPCRLMRVLSPIIQVSVLSVSHTRHHNPLRSGITA
jgi:hypothetical protein